jgi:hypothetical protein
VVVVEVPCEITKRAFASVAAPVPTVTVVKCTALRVMFAWATNRWLSALAPARRLPLKFPGTV